MKRDDISENLVHFIKGEGFDDAFETLRKIVKEKRLLGGTGYIKGGYRCVCFSEAPVHHLESALMRRTVHGVHWRPFGIVVSKSWLFAHGGRPVIYQTDEEFLTLPENMRWRHVRYEPVADLPVDFSWEREWRIRTDALSISPEAAHIVLPTDEWFEKLRCAHDRDESYDAEMYELIMGNLAWQMVEVFPWTTQVIKRISA
jgi:hypothetical protein